MKKHLPIFALLVLAAPYGYAQADGPDPVPPLDNRMKVLMYDESDVYTIVTKYGYQTNMVFAPDEEVQTISMGDRSLWQIIPAGPRLFIRPMDDNVTTNMTIITNKRSYQFDLKSLASDSSEKPIYVAKFMYPEDKRKKRPPMRMMDGPPPPPMGDIPPPPPPPPPATGDAIMPFKPLPPAPPVARAEIPVAPNYNYTYSGPDALAPVKVFDDGKSTFFKYRMMGKPLPKVFAKNTAEAERPVVSYTKGDLLVVDEVAGEFRIQHPNGTVIIYNEMLNPR